MVARVKSFFRLLYQSSVSLAENNGIETAGYLTYLLLLTIFPYLILMVAAMGLVGQGETGRHFISIFLAQLPAEAVNALSPRIVEILAAPPQGLLTFSILGAIWTSSSAIESIRRALNRTYHVKAPPRYWKRRLRSILEILILTLLIVLVVLVLVFTPIALHYVSTYTAIHVPFALNTFIRKYFILIGGIAIFGLVASFYYVLPNVQQRLRCIAPGAVVTVTLWFICVMGVPFYFSTISQLTPIYGSLSGFIATLVFFYVMTVIFLYGAEFNHTLCTAHSHEEKEAEGK